MKFYLTKYMAGDGKYYAESWVQINIFGRCFCLFKRKIEIHPKPSEAFILAAQAVSTDV